MPVELRIEGEPLPPGVVVVLADETGLMQPGAP